VEGPGCNKKGASIRKDLPLHDMTGGAGFWVPDAIKYLDTKGMLRLGGGLTDVQLAALDNGQLRAKKQLSEAATIEIVGNTNTVKVTNLTGHKLITGYPEGRRMWLRTAWYDADGNVLRVDGEYGPLYMADGVTPVTVTNPANGTTVQVRSLIDSYDPNTVVYEAHYGISKDWAVTVADLLPGLVLSYDRYTGQPDYHIEDLLAAPDGAVHETFHFVLNNVVVKDNRIPPYGMSYNIAAKRNALPVPADQYGNPGPSGTYDYHDYVDLKPPAGAVYADMELLYQATSWEYVQFLYLANNLPQNAFLADEGIIMLDAWLNTQSETVLLDGTVITSTMAEPYRMASTVWGKKPPPQVKDIFTDSLSTLLIDRKGNENITDVFSAGDTVTIRAHAVETVDTTPINVEGAQVLIDVLDNGAVVQSLQGFTDAVGNADINWKTSRKLTKGNYTAKVTEIIKAGYQFDPASGQEKSFTIQ
jgi:hypothetical protein